MGRPGREQLCRWRDAAAILEGPVAEPQGELGRQRWKAGDRTGAGARRRRLRARGPRRAVPQYLRGDLQIAAGGEAPIFQIETAYLTLIARARRYIYAESQYFASRRIAEAVAQRLDDPNGRESPVKSLQVKRLARSC